MYNAERTSIVDRREMLKVKIKSLAAESKMIRREEIGQKRINAKSGVAAIELMTELWTHRTQVVRPASRLTHLAYGLIRGKTLEQMENKSPPLSDSDKKQVKEMIRKYGPRQGFELPAFLNS